MSTTFRDLVSFYLTQCEAEGNIPKTIATKRYALDDFVLSCPEEAALLTPAHVFAWVQRCRERGMRPGGIASYQGAVWHFLRWLHDNDFVAVDLSRKIKRIHPKPAEVQRPAVAEDMLRKMLEVAENQHEHPYRNHAVISVLADTGIRRTELSMCDFGDLDLEAGTLFVRHGKGGKTRLIGVGAAARTSLWRYFTARNGDHRKHYGRGMQPGPLFLARGGVRMSSSAIRDMLRHVSLLADRGARPVTSHPLRRSTANRLLGQAAPLGDVMHQLGHSQPGMTLLYGQEQAEERAIATFHQLDQGVRPLRRKA